MKKVTAFRDIESGEIVTVKQLFKEYSERIGTGEIDEYMTFDEYIINSLTMFNGTLEEV